MWRAGLGNAVAKDAEDDVFAIINEVLANGEEVRIAEIRTFGTRSRLVRAGRNASADETVSISASPTFKAGRRLRMS